MRYLGPLTPPNDGDAGWDLAATHDAIVLPNRQSIIRTGVHLAIPEGWVGLIKERSSMSLERCYAHAGVIDSSYRGEVVVVLSNNGVSPISIEAGDRIAQIVVVPHLPGHLGIQSKRLPTSKRGDRGFGSSGK